MQARGESVCAACRQVILSGEWISLDSLGEWIHQPVCPASGPQGVPWSVIETPSLPWAPGTPPRAVHGVPTRLPIHRRRAFRPLHVIAFDTCPHGEPPPASVADESRGLRWEHATEIPLTVAALIFLVVYASPILEPSIDNGSEGLWLTIATAAAWAFFAVDYAVRLGLSRERGRFVRTHFLDLLAFVVPILRPLRPLRLITVLGVLNRAAGSSFRGRVVIYAAG